MPCTLKSRHQLYPKLIEFTKRVRTQLIEMHQSLLKLLEPSQNEIDQIHQKSENPVKQNAPKSKVTRVTGT